MIVNPDVVAIQNPKSPKNTSKNFEKRRKTTC